jgi:hypothetical protein
MRKMLNLLFLLVLSSSFFTVYAQHQVSIRVGADCAVGPTTGIVFPTPYTNITEGATYTVEGGTLPSGYSYVQTLFNALRGSTFQLEGSSLTEDVQVDWVLWNLSCENGVYLPTGSLLETVFNSNFIVYHQVGPLWIPVEPYQFENGKKAILSLKNTTAFQNLINTTIPNGDAGLLYFAYYVNSSFDDAGLTFIPPASLTDTSQFWVIKASHFSNIVGGNKSQITGISNNNNLKLPSAFELKQNYPNPFNPSTIIEYALPERANVELNVYNILGVKVATLVKSVKEAGIYKVEFNGANLSSGLYIYELKTNKITLLGKMLLLK